MFFRFLSFLGRLFLSPQNGWEDLDVAMTARSSKTRLRTLYRAGFLPLLIVASLSVFVRLFYAGNPGFLGLLQMGIIWFTALFVGYHVAVFVLSLSIKKLLPVGTGVETARLNLLAMFAISMLAAIALLANVVKVHLVIIDVLPVYVVFVLWRSSRFVGVEPKDEGLYTLVSSVATIGVVYMLRVLFDILL